MRTTQLLWQRTEISATRHAVSRNRDEAEAVPHSLITRPSFETRPLFLNKGCYPPWPLNETGFYSREASIQNNTVIDSREFARHKGKNIIADWSLHQVPKSDARVVQCVTGTRESSVMQRVAMFHWTGLVKKIGLDLARNSEWTYYTNEQTDKRRNSEHYCELFYTQIFL